VLAAANAFRKAGLRRQYTVAIQEAAASASRWIPLCILMSIRLNSHPLLYLAILDKQGRMKLKAVFCPNKKSNAMKVRAAAEFTANHRYWNVSQRDGGSWPEPLVPLGSVCGVGSLNRKNDIQRMAMILTIGTELERKSCCRNGKTKLRGGNQCRGQEKDSQGEWVLGDHSENSHYT